jgi:hypothetical protein
LKTFLIIIYASFLVGTQGFAEMQFPDFESLNPKNQHAWGYIVHRTKGTNPNLKITIPPAAAKLCKGVRLYTKTSTGRLLSECNISPTKNGNGSLQIALEVFEELNGYAEVVIYSEEMPGAPMKGDFGGFTFKLRKD